jgi:hypothetical protein
MSKYERLGAYLRHQHNNEVPMTFAEIERVVGVKLPASQKHQAWWSNSTSNNVMTQIWLDAGFRTERVDVAAGKLVFRRVSAAAATNGMQESERMFKHAEKETNAKSRQHPLVGCMKGTFTIEPGYDLTRPSMDDDELAEMDANLDRLADMVEQGMTKKR